MSRHVIGEGKTRFGVTDLFHIGDYVARVIQDDRTLNQTVFIWEDEITQQQAWELAVKKFGEDILKTKIQVGRPAMLICQRRKLTIHLTAPGSGLLEGSRGRPRRRP